MWSLWIDTGGTFTDGVARTPAGATRRVKILSTSALRGKVLGSDAPGRIGIEPRWDDVAGLVEGFRFRLLGRPGEERRVVRFSVADGLLELDRGLDPAATAGDSFELISDEPAPLLAARLLTGTPAGRALPPARMRLATTLGTNALLERRGVATALFITRGFGDVPLIGTQQRPDLFRLDIVRPAPLHQEVVEVDERVDSSGAVLRALDLGTVAARAETLVESGVRVAAVALMHAYVNGEHELLLRERLLEAGFEHVSCSHELAPRIKLLARARTAIVDAYLAPVLREYLERVAGALAESSLLVATSAGGLLDARGFRPKDSLLSGPACGVVGAARAARAAGFERAIGFDMGGTSTDVARYDGEYEYRYEHAVGDAELAAPALAIETVAAGGGSICWLDGERLRVGPQSAGAEPGPACYGAGGPLTLTDVNLLLGRIDPSRFEIPILAGPARRRLDALQERVAERMGERPGPEELLEGLRAIADETMADAIRRISLRRGFDPAEYALVAFGGAGAQHACAIADRLGIGRVVVPADAALLSALGLGAAVVERFVERQILEPLDEALALLSARFDALAAEAIEAVAAAGVPRDEIEVRRRILHLRFSGQDATLDVDWNPDRSAARAFSRAYLALYGHLPERRPVELESMRVVASSSRIAEPPSAGTTAPRRAVAAGTTRAYLAGSWLEVPTFDRDALEPGAALDGPALIRERHSSTVVEPGFRATVDGSGALLLQGSTNHPTGTGESRPEAVRLELFTQRFSTLVREMGERLERTAVSTNVKERLDFSCALLDPAGELVVNAPHIPVHLGALGLCVRTVRAQLDLSPGDVVVTNHPAFGGSHLPDVTLITPVFSPSDRERLIGYLASRAHHAEIGGSRPGSMPPAATRLAEEGVVIPPTLLVRAGKPRWDALRRMLAAPPWPSRAIEDNLADLRAALAANHAGSVALCALVDAHGDDTVALYMGRLQELAARRVGEALERIADGVYEATETLDDGSPLRACIHVAGARARIDFAGSAPVHAGNLNATPAIVQSAVLYVLRLLLREPLPLNEGLLRAVTIDLPPGLLNPNFPEDPRQAPAVVGGNVETSQRLVDTLLRALGLAACSQGTMNNLLFGGGGYGYYETLGGGAGAGPDWHGASGVHTHMTNTRITDAEVLEHRYPVRVERFGLRRGSGGSGKFHGGDGLIREIRFLETAAVSMLTQHRAIAPYGMAGGAPGSPGAQRVIRADGTVCVLGAIDGCEVEPGDRLVVETPGGGGWGSAE